MSIRAKLTIMFLLIALVPALFVSALTFTNYKNSLEASHLSQMRNLVIFKADVIEAYFAGLKINIETAQGFYNIKKNLPVLSRLSGNPSHPEFLAGKKMLDAQLRHTQEVLGLYDIMLVNPEGKVVYASNPKHFSKDFLTVLPDPYQKAFTEGKNKVYFSDVFLSKAQVNQAEMLVAAPAFNPAGAFIGVIAFEVDMARLYSIIQDVTGLGDTGETLVGKRIGNEAVYLNPLRHDPQAVLKRKARLGQEEGHPIQEAVQGRTGAGLSIDYRGKEVIAAWRYLPLLDWGVVAKIDSREAFADVSRSRNLVMIILAMIFVLGGTIAFIMARSVSEPIKKLSKGAEIIGSGNLDYSVATGLKDEIGQLSRSFDKMTRDLKKITASRDELNREIAKREQSEVSLLRAKEEWERTFDSVPDLIAILDTRHRIVRVNRAMANQLGLKPEECVGLPCYKYVHGLSAPPDFCPHTHSLRDGCQHMFELNEERLGGDMLVSTTPTLNERGEITGSVHVARNISELKQREIEITALLEASRAVMEQREFKDTARFIFDSCKKLMGATAGYVALLSKDGNENEVLFLDAGGLPCIVDPSLPMPVRGLRGIAYTFGKTVYENDFPRSEWVKFMPEGHAALNNVMFAPLIIGADTVGILGLANKNGGFTDNDARMATAFGELASIALHNSRLFESLRESEKRMNRSQEIAHLGSWELDLVNNRLYWSDEVYRIFGLKPQEFGATYEVFLEAVHPEDRTLVDAAYSGSLREGRDTYEIEHRIVRKATGEIRTVHEKCEHFKDESGRIIRSVGMVHDVTERKHLEEERERLLEELLRSNKELEQFAYIASHDLQEPLRMISSYVQLINYRYKDRLDSDADEFINYVVKGALHMQTLLNDLLTYSRAGSRSEPFKLIDLKSAIEKALINLKVEIDGSSTVITVENLPVVYADEVQMVQVFQNLLSNAMKFCNAATPRISVSAGMKDDEWAVRVKDNGIGVDPKYFDKIFHIFKRLHTKEKYEGTGIGLAICKKIIERHGGRIWVESEPGKGATFCFTIPAKREGQGSGDRETWEGNGAGI